MNKLRRSQIEKVIGKIEEIGSELDELRGEEQFYLDSMPENLWSSERAEKAEEAVEAMDDAVNELDLIVDNLREIIY